MKNSYLVCCPAQSVVIIVTFFLAFNQSLWAIIPGITMTLLLRAERK
jgi:hypothetical protein